jgi:hypothetical protein
MWMFLQQYMVAGQIELGLAAAILMDVVADMKQVGTGDPRPSVWKGCSRACWRGADVGREAIAGLQCQP